MSGRTPTADVAVGIAARSVGGADHAAYLGCLDALESVGGALDIRVAAARTTAAEQAAADTARTADKGREVAQARRALEGTWNETRALLAGVGHHLPPRIRPTIPDPGQGAPAALAAVARERQTVVAAIDAQRNRHRLDEAASARAARERERLAAEAERRRAEEVVRTREALARRREAALLEQRRRADEEASAMRRKTRRRRLRLGVGGGFVVFAGAVVAALAVLH